jgi:ribose transport system permease protein
MLQRFKGLARRGDAALPVASFTVAACAFVIVPGLTGNALGGFDIYNAMQGFAVLGPVTLALGITILAGEFDLSVLGMLALGGVIAIRLGGTHGAFGVLVAVAACAMLGAVQGAIISIARIHSMPVTLGGYIALLGLSNVLAKGQTLTFTNSGASVWVDQPILTWFSPRSLIAVAAFVVIGVALVATPVGAELRAMGSNRRASRVVGIPVGRRMTMVFALSAALCGLSGALLAYSDASASLDPGFQPFILAATATVLGGCALSGGRGRVWGLLLGALAITLVQQLFAVIALDVSTAQIVFGAVLIAVAINAEDVWWSLRRLTRGRGQAPGPGSVDQNFPTPRSLQLEANGKGAPHEHSSRA